MRAMTQDTKTDKNPLAGATVLVVEDDAEDARFAMKLVESLGGRVFACGHRQRGARPLR